MVIMLYTNQFKLSFWISIRKCFVVITLFDRHAKKKFHLPLNAVSHALHYNCLAADHRRVNLPKMGDFHPSLFEQMRLMQVTQLRAIASQLRQVVDAFLSRPRRFLLVF